MNNLHPIFAQALKPFTPPAITPIETYKHALMRFDWQFQFSDDGSAVRRARAALELLREQQTELDPSGEIWNQYRGDPFGTPAPCVVEVAA